MNLKYIRDRGNNHYEVRKTINDKLKSYGVYQSLEDAIKVRDTLVSVNWGLPTNSMRNISTYPNGSYRVIKQMNGEVIWSSYHKTLTEAQTCRDELERINYDIDLLDTTSLNDDFKKPSCKINYKPETNWKGITIT